MEKQPANPESSFDGIMTCEELHGDKTYLQFDFTASSLRLRESQSFIWSLKQGASSRHPNSQASTLPWVYT